MFHLQLLAPEVLHGAKFLGALLPWESEDQEPPTSSVGPSLSGAFLASRDLDSVRTACLGDDGKVLGPCSFCEYRALPDEVWLAWSGLAPRACGRGLGGKMLDWVIAGSRQDAESVQLLWTTIEEEYATALQLYAGPGFRAELQQALPGENWHPVVQFLYLSGGTPRLGNSREHGSTLSGRVTPLAA